MHCGFWCFVGYAYSFVIPTMSFYCGLWYISNPSPNPNSKDSAPYFRG